MRRADAETLNGAFTWPWPIAWPGAAACFGAPAPAGGNGSFASAGAGVSFAPEQLWQPVNPGWSFGNVTINAANSSAPEVEQAVVARASYGKQIGRIVDALQVLIDAAAPALHAQPAIAEFTALAVEVNAAKSAAQAARLVRLQAELAALKKLDRAAWARLVETSL